MKLTELKRDDGWHWAEVDEDGEVIHLHPHVHTTKKEATAERREYQASLPEPPRASEHTIDIHVPTERKGIL